MDFEMNVLFNNVATLVAIIPQIGHFVLFR